MKTFQYLFCNYVILSENDANVLTSGYIFKRVDGWFHFGYGQIRNYCA